MNAADSAWMLTSTALVLFMVPGLALFYGGLVGEKNVVAMMAESFVAIGVVSILWVVVGYPLAFGTDHDGLI
jgi:Amt family ammonium transporter